MSPPLFPLLLFLYFCQAMGYSPSHSDNMQRLAPAFRRWQPLKCVTKCSACRTQSQAFSSSTNNRSNSARHNCPAGTWGVELLRLFYLESNCSVSTFVHSYVQHLGEFIVLLFFIKNLFRREFVQCSWIIIVQKNAKRHWLEGHLDGTFKV